jgi:ADP-L-glycero-D-manno-heptose 6-epimerase
MSERERFIVTGGAGFVGSNLVAALLQRTPRPEIVVIDSFRSGSFASIIEACARAGVGAFEGRVIAKSTARLAWARLIARVEPKAIFHLGAITDTTLSDEPTMLRENVGGFARLLQASADADVPLVYASSAATYGTPPQTAQRVPFPESAAGKPNNIYGFSKWLMECEHRRFERAQLESRMQPGPIAGVLAEAMKRLGSVQAPRIVGLRYFNVFGPGEARKGKMASMVYQLAMQLLSGKAPRLFADGTQARDQIHVDDVVSCTIAAAGLGMRPDPTPGIYNLGSGRATSFNEIIEALRSAMEIPAKQRATEYFEMPATIRAFYQEYTSAEMSHTSQGLGWKPRLNPAEAIRLYGEWLRCERA